MTQTQTRQTGKTEKDSSSPDPSGRSERLLTETPTYRIFVHNLILPALIGIYPHEKERQQSVRITVEIESLDQQEKKTDDIASVLSYEDIVLGIKTLLAKGHIGLVETLAERIADFCLSKPRCLKARIRVEKLEAFTQAESVGVEIERTRTA